MGTTAATFSGNSQYAADFQQVINQAVTVASIPMELLQNDVYGFQNQNTELSTLQTDFGNIQSAIQSLVAGTGGGALNATSSDSSVATATINSSSVIGAASYTVNVIDPGAPTTALSNDGLPTVTDPSSTSISSSSSYTLTVNGTNTTITPGSNNLNSLVQAINASGAGVSANIINIGSPSSPDYRLSIQSNTLDNVSIQLNDGSQDLLNTLTTGNQAQYQVNGLPSTPISSTSSTVSIAPGVNVNLLAAGQTTISVAPDSSAASKALSSFVTAYNSAVTELSNNRGTGTGPLNGLSIVYSLQESLRQITGYTGGSGAVTSLANLGVTFNGDTGQLTFNQTQFDSVSATNSSDVANFLGSATGGGFLTTATNVLNGLTDPATGILQSTITANQNLITQDNQKIADDQANVITMQNNLVAQLTQADTAIASLESQVTYFNNLFLAQNALANG